MHKNFLTFASIFTLVFFLGTPLSAFALTAQQTQQLATLLVLQQSGAITPQDAQTLLLLQQLQRQQQPYYGQQPYSGYGQQGYGAGGGGGGLAQGLLLSSVLSGQGGGLGGGAGGINPLLLAGVLGGGGFGGGGGGALGGVSQGLMLGGMLSGNMGLLIAGMITNMIGGLVGGAGGTPQRGAVDEGYVAPGQAGPYGAGGYNPYYTTPTPIPAAAPVASCEKTIFIVKNTTVTPNVVSAYPNDRTLSIKQNECVLVINQESDDHTVKVREQGQDAVKKSVSITKQTAQILRFETKKTYTLCVDSATTACSTVAVQ